MLLRLAPQHVGLFRFLLEGYDNLALFTVLDPKEASLKLLFSPHQADQVERALAAMGELVVFTVSPWPWDA